jgi:positive regulator of sigma E activity
MKEIGQILKIEMEMVTVKGGELTSCSGCMNHTCQTSDKIFTAINKKHLDLQPGQLVEVENPLKNTILQVVLIFIIPLLFCVAGYILAIMWFPDTTQDVHIGIGVVALFAGFIIVYLFHHFVSSIGTPQITGILSNQTAHNEG